MRALDDEIHEVAATYRQRERWKRPPPPDYGFDPDMVDPELLNGATDEEDGS